MDIRRIDVHDDDLFTDFYEIMRTAELFERPGMPMWSAHEGAVMFREADPDQETRAYAAFEGETMVGAASMFLPLKDNTDKVYAGVHVAPDRRRRGIGSVLLEHLVSETKGAGRSTMLAEASYSLLQRETHPYRRFAEKHGLRLASVEIHRALALPVADELIQQWILDAAPHHADYRLQTFVDDIPEDLLESYCYLLNQLAVDAPSGDIDYEPEGLTPESFRIHQHTLKKQGRTSYATLAIDSAGQAVAHTDLVVPADPGNVYQWGTLVRQDHRGHRLGLAVKARNLLTMQAAHPDRRRIFTCNSEVNDSMVAINERMGFEPVEMVAEFQLKLDA